MMDGPRRGTIQREESKGKDHKSSPAEDASSSEVVGDIDAPNALLRGLKKPLLIRELPQPSTPKVSRQGTAPVPQSPAVGKEKVKSISMTHPLTAL